MSLNRYAAKRDTAEKPICQALDRVGASYLYQDNVDLLVLFRGDLFLLECKTGKGSKTPKQQQLAALGWPIHFVTTPEEALKVIGVV